MTAIPKTHKPVDNDPETRLLLDRYRQLDGYSNMIAEEMVDIRGKLLVRADELQAEQLTIGGRVVVDVSRFDKLTVAAKEIFTRYPKIFMRFGSITPVTRVTVR